jgi:prepilin-type N-terminal cleavage/methylation domain-containing protein
MSSHGYTLVEMLVALAVVGMTAAGLAEAAHALTHIEGETTATLGRERAMATAQARFGDFLRGRGPFRSDDRQAGFDGSPDQLALPCGEETCTAQLLARKSGAVLELGFEDGTHADLALPGVAGASFAYDDGKTLRSDWPPSDPARRLTSVTILGGFEPDQYPLAVAALDLEQSPDCEFDPIVKQCRARHDEPG